MTASRIESVRTTLVALRRGSMLLSALLLAACSTSVPSSPSASPIPVGTGPSTPPASVQPSATPTATPDLTAGSPGIGTFHVALLNETGRDITIDVKDESGRLLTAASGTPGDGGATVEQNVLRVENDAPSTLRLTWAGPPCADSDLLVIDAAVSRFTIVQLPCSGDAIAFDRILLLTFSGSISAADVEAVIQAGGDTPS